MSQHKYEVIRHFTNEIELFVKNRFLHLVCKKNRFLDYIYISIYIYYVRFKPLKTQVD